MVALVLRTRSTGPKGPVITGISNHISDTNFNGNSVINTDISDNITNSDIVNIKSGNVTNTIKSGNVTNNTNNTCVSANPCT